MNIKQYKNRQVEITRLFYVGDECLVNLRDVANGETINGVPLEELNGKSQKHSEDLVAFHNKKLNLHKEFVKGSEDYKAFIAEHNLNPMFIENCLKGISKTHKGFTIKSSLK